MFNLSTEELKRHSNGPNDAPLGQYFKRNEGDNWGSINNKVSLLMTPFIKSSNKLNKHLYK